MYCADREVVLQSTQIGDNVTSSSLETTDDFNSSQHEQLQKFENREQLVEYEKDGDDSESDYLLTSCDSQNQTNSLVPIGQSLSVYAAIAAQAGISTAYQPLLTSIEDESSIQMEEEEEKTHEPIVPISHDHHKHFQASQPENAPPTSLPECVREIGKIRRYSAQLGDFGGWEDLPYQSLGGAPPRRWRELNIDESIEIPLRRGGRLRVFPNFLTSHKLLGL